MTIIRPRPTREQFERDFVNVDIPDDNYEIARKNTEEGKRRILARNLPSDGRETGNILLKNHANLRLVQDLLGHSSPNTTQS